MSFVTGKQGSFLRLMEEESEAEGEQTPRTFHGLQSSCAEQGFPVVLMPPASHGRFGTLLFFLDFNMNQHQNGRIERLAILGPMRARRGTELKAHAEEEWRGRRRGARSRSKSSVLLC